jgi:hypothetical protein
MNASSGLKITALAGAAAAALGAGLVLFVCDPAGVPIYPVCLFHKVTGLSCPGCGALRALHALLHGQWLAALHFNLLLVVSLPLFSWIAFRLVWDRVHGGPAMAIRPLWLWLYVITWAAFGCLRNVPFFTFLR